MASSGQASQKRRQTQYYTGPRTKAPYMPPTSPFFKPRPAASKTTLSQSQGKQDDPEHAVAVSVKHTQPVPIMMPPPQRKGSSPPEPAMSRTFSVRPRSAGLKENPMKRSEVPTQPVPPIPTPSIVIHDTNATPKSQRGFSPYRPGSVNGGGQTLPVPFTSFDQITPTKICPPEPLPPIPAHHRVLRKPVGPRAATDRKPSSTKPDAPQRAHTHDTQIPAAKKTAGNQEYSVFPHEAQAAPSVSSNTFSDKSHDTPQQRSPSTSRSPPRLNDRPMHRRATDVSSFSQSKPALSRQSSTSTNANFSRPNPRVASALTREALLKGLTPEDLGRQSKGLRRRSATWSKSNVLRDSERMSMTRPFNKRNSSFQNGTRDRSGKDVLSRVSTSRVLKQASSTDNLVSNFFKKARGQTPSPRADDGRTITWGFKKFNKRTKGSPRWTPSNERNGNFEPAPDLSRGRSGYSVHHARQNSVLHQSEVDTENMANARASVASSTSSKRSGGFWGNVFAFSGERNGQRNQRAKKRKIRAFRRSRGARVSFSPAQRLGNMTSNVTSNMTNRFRRNRESVVLRAPVQRRSTFMGMSLRSQDQAAQEPNQSMHGTAHQKHSFFPKQQPMQSPIRHVRGTPFHVMNAAEPAEPFLQAPPQVPMMPVTISGAMRGEPAQDRSRSEPPKRSARPGPLTWIKKGRTFAGNPTNRRRSMSAPPAPGSISGNMFSFLRRRKSSRRSRTFMGRPKRQSIVVGERGYFDFAPNQSGFAFTPDMNLEQQAPGFARKTTTLSVAPQLDVKYAQDAPAMPTKAQAAAPRQSRVPKQPPRITTPPRRDSDDWATTAGTLTPWMDRDFHDSLFSKEPTPGAKGRSSLVSQATTFKGSVMARGREAYLPESAKMPPADFVARMSEEYPPVPQLPDLDDGVVMGAYSLPATSPWAQDCFKHLTPIRAQPTAGLEVPPNFRPETFASSFIEREDGEMIQIGLGCTPGPMVQNFDESISSGSRDSATLGHSNPAGYRASMGTLNREIDMVMGQYRESAPLGPVSGEGTMPSLPNMDPLSAMSMPKEYEKQSDDESSSDVPGESQDVDEQYEDEETDPVTARLSRFPDRRSQAANIAKGSPTLGYMDHEPLPPLPNRAKSPAPTKSPVPPEIERAVTPDYDGQGYGSDYYDTEEDSFADEEDYTDSEDGSFVEDEEVVPQHSGDLPRPLSSIGEESEPEPETAHPFRRANIRASQFPEPPTLTQAQATTPRAALLERGMPSTGINDRRSALTPWDYGSNPDYWASDATPAVPELPKTPVPATRSDSPLADILADFADEPHDGDFVASTPPLSDGDSIDEPDEMPTPEMEAAAVDPSGKGKASSWSQPAEATNNTERALVPTKSGALMENRMSTGPWIMGESITLVEKRTRWVKQGGLYSFDVHEEENTTENMFSAKAATQSTSSNRTRHHRFGSMQRPASGIWGAKRPESITINGEIFI